MNRPPAPPVPRMRPPAMPQRTAPARPPAAPPPDEPGERASAVRRRVRGAVRARRCALAGELRRPGPSRRRARLGALLVAAVLVVLVALPLLLAFAPLFTVARVEVPGATPEVAQQVRTALAGQQGRPIAVVGDDEVATALASVPAVQSFSVVRRPPATLEVRVVQRTPVAQQRSGTQWQQVDAARVVIAAADAQWPDLPVVSVGGDRPAAAFTAAMAAIAAVRARDLQVGDVRAAGPDDVVLTLPGGRTVRWGGAEDGAAKAEALAAALVRAARGVEEIDVSSPGVVLTR